MPGLVAEGLYRFFHTGDAETIALREVSLAIEPGEFVALVGPSGSGKSTLLACLAGLDEPDGGTVYVMGERLSHRPEEARTRVRARHIGLFMQSGNLFEHLSVRENAALQQLLSGSDENLPALLAAVGLTERANHRPGQLSGGEAARAGLCVALASRPGVLLCDEPTAELDRGNEQAIIGLLKQRQETGAAVLVATHSPTLAAEADRVLTIADGRLT